MPDKKPTDTEIIKALEEILEIMLVMGDLQKSSTISKTLDLITRLQAENKNLKAEIQELKIEINMFRGYDEEIKAEAYKEFAEKLKKHSYYDHKDQRNVVAEVIIDHYLKELVGEDDGEEEK